MKKYEKPEIEIVGANLSAEYMLAGGPDSGPGIGNYSVGTERGAKGKEDDDFEDEGW